jgi:hypothetical protein
MKNVLFCVVMGLLLIGCSQNDEIIRQNSENIVSKAVTASGYHLSSYSVGLMTPSGSEIVRILDPNGNTAWVHWSTDAFLTDASVASSGYGPSITISAEGDHPSGSVNVWVNGKNIGPVLVHKKSTGGGSGRDTTDMGSVSGGDLQ